MNSIPSETNHYTLTKKQLTLLNLLYRFRFSTSALISQTTKINPRTINKRLQLLLEQNYIGRNYEDSYRLLQKHATYYLLLKGRQELRQLSKTKYGAKTLANYRNNESISDRYIDHYLAVFKAYNQLNTRYGNDLHFFTKAQLADYAHFPKPLPDAYMQLSVSGVRKQFFLDVLHESDPFFLGTRKIVQYIDFVSDGIEEWKRKTKTDMPKVLILCDNPSLQKRLAKKMKRAVVDVDSRKLKFYISNTNDLKDEAAWHDMSDMDERLSLSDI
jgi:Replication-relaxation